MSHTILPPRFEDRAAELEATFPVIPVYEEVSGSLRPTWIPDDPTTFIPPAPRKSRAKTLALAATLGLLTWGIGFAAVVGGHAVEARYSRKANAASAPVAESHPAPVVEQPRTQTATPTVATIATAPRTKELGDSGILITIDVNDLPVIKPGKGRAKQRRAGS